MIRKFCSKCRKKKNSTQSSYCKDCRKKYYNERREEFKKKQKKYDDKNREKLRKKSRKYYQKNKDKLKQNRINLKIDTFIHYGGNPPKCACCGETEIKFLTIDHIHGLGKRHRKLIGINFYYWLKNNNYPEGYQVLCWNCNLAKALFGLCPHKEFKT